MSETSADTKNTELQKIDIMSTVESFLQWLRRKWWVVVLLTLLGGGLFYLRSSRTYQYSTYTAEATVSVKAVSIGSSYDNSAASAQQLGKVFPYILTSGVLKDIVAEDLGTNGIPGSINVTNIDGTNLLTIKATANSEEMASALLQSFIKNYGEVAQYVVGQTELSLINDNSQTITVTSASANVRRSVIKGAGLGFMAGMLIVFLYMLVYKTIKTSSELRKLINAPYLGSLPIYHRRIRRKNFHEGINILGEDAQKDYVESIRVIRTRLEHRLEANHIKTILVTSSIPGEGKSTVSANLAISLAKAGKSVALVDCDLRNPSSQEVFNRKGIEYPGLASVLRGTTQLKDALVKVQDDLELYCLFGASKGTQKVEILGKQEMGDLIHHLESNVDYVILDTPPSAMLVDASILVKHVQSAVYVIMSDYARRQYILKGIEELQDAGVQIEGCVLNGSKESSYSHKSKK